MRDDEKRKRRLDRIHGMSDRIGDIAQSYRRLAWMANDPNVPSAFLALVEAAGEMTLEDLIGASDLLQLLERAGRRINAAGPGSGVCNEIT